MMSEHKEMDPQLLKDIEHIMMLEQKEIDPQLLKDIQDIENNTPKNLSEEGKMKWYKQCVKKLEDFQLMLSDPKKSKRMWLEAAKVVKK